jgi:hypothetical protein
MNDLFKRRIPGAGSVSGLTIIDTAPGFFVQMKYRFPILLIPILLLIINACDLFGGYSQSYVIIINRSVVGKEMVSEKTNFKGDLVCLSEQERDTFGSKEKKQQIIRTRMVFQEGETFPVSYSYDSSAGTSYDVKVRDDQIIRTTRNEGKSQEIVTPFEPNMLMFDMNAFYTIAYWISNYDIDKWGRQLFQTYLLPAGSVAKLHVEPAAVNLTIHETMGLRLRNYKIEFGDQMSMFLWVDEDKRLCRMFFRGPNVEVIRSDLYEMIKKMESEDKKS